MGVGITRHGVAHGDAPAVEDVERRTRILVRLGKDDPAIPNQRVDMEDIAGDEALEEEVRLAVAKIVEYRPDVVGVLDATDADGRDFRSGLEEPGAGNVGQVGAETVVGERRREGRNRHAGPASADAHGEFVAHELCRARPETGEAEMFAERGGGLDVVVVKSHDTIDNLGAGKIADAVDNVRYPRQVRHGVQLVDRLARPGGFLERFDGQEDRPRPASFGFADELRALFIAGEAEDRRHASEYSAKEKPERGGRLGDGAGWCTSDGPETAGGGRRTAELVRGGREGCVARDSRRLPRFHSGHPGGCFRDIPHTVLQGDCAPDRPCGPPRFTFSVACLWTWRGRPCPVPPTKHRRGRARTRSIAQTVRSASTCAFCSSRRAKSAWMRSWTS